MGNLTWIIFFAFISLQYVTTDAAIIRRRASSEEAGSEEEQVFNALEAEFGSRGEFCAKFAPLWDIDDLRPLFIQASSNENDGAGAAAFFEGAKPICKDPNSTTDDLMKYVFASFTSDFESESDEK